MVELGEAVETPVGHAPGQQLVGDSCGFGLQVGVQREDVDPATRLSELAQSFAAVCLEHPPSSAVDGEEAGEALGPTP